MRFLLRDQPVQVCPDRVESVEGDHGSGQVHRFQQFGEMAGLVSDLEQRQIPKI